MDEQKQNELTEKYLNATSTLQEEEELFNTDSPEAWATFVQKQKKRIPEGLEREVMSAIGKKAKSKRRFLNRTLPIAATVALLLSFLFIPSKEKEMTYEQKVELLEQALSGFQEKGNPIPERNVIYEDELLVVYLTNN